MHSVFFLCADLVARILALAGGCIKSRHRFAIERRIRGTFLRPVFGSAKLTIGRVRFESFRGVTLGKSVKLYCGSVLVPGADGLIEIGQNTHLGYNCVVSGGGKIRIGADCAISSQVSIYSVSNVPKAGEVITDSRHKAPVTIGDGVLIGTGASILPGVTIHSGAVIAAGAVVHKDVPEGAVVGGVPAKSLR